MMRREDHQRRTNWRRPGSARCCDWAWNVPEVAGAQRAVGPRTFLTRPVSEQISQSQGNTGLSSPSSVLNGTCATAMQYSSSPIARAYQSPKERGAPENGPTTEAVSVIGVSRPDTVAQLSGGCECSKRFGAHMSARRRRTARERSPWDTRARACDGQRAGSRRTVKKGATAGSQSPVGKPENHFHFQPRDDDDAPGGTLSRLAITDLEMAVLEVGLRSILSVIGVRDS